MSRDDSYVNLIANRMFTGGSEATSMVPGTLHILIVITSLKYMQYDYNGNKN